MSKDDYKGFFWKLFFFFNYIGAILVFTFGGVIISFLIGGFSYLLYGLIAGILSGIAYAFFDNFVMKKYGDSLPIFIILFVLFAGLGFAFFMKFIW